MRDVDLAYLAGVIDADGYVTAPHMTRSIRSCPRCLGRDGEHFPECPIPVLATTSPSAPKPRTRRRRPKPCLETTNELPLPVRSTLHRR